MSGFFSTPLGALADGLGRGNRTLVVAQHRGRAFESVDSAPMGETVQLQVRDALGTYVLPVGFALTASGWINPDLGTALGAGLEVIGWRRRSFR